MLNGNQALFIIIKRHSELLTVTLIKTRFTFKSQRAVSGKTNHKAELDSAEGQSVQVVMDTAIDGATLARKALGVDDTGSPLPCDCIKPTERKESIGHHCSLLNEHKT